MRPACVQTNQQKQRDFYRCFMPHSAFGALLKQLRAKHDLTQAELGERIGMTHVTVGDWERGKRNPRRENVKALAAALDEPLRPLMEAAFAGNEPEIKRELDSDFLPVPEGYNDLDASGREFVDQSLQVAVEAALRLQRRGAFGYTEDKD